MPVRSAVAAAVAAALALVVVASPLGTAPGGLGHGPPVVAGLADLPTPADADGVSANVTWNGVDVGHASSAASAFVVGAGQSATVRFNYSEAVGVPTVVNATLLLLFLGVTLSSESIAPASVGLAGAAVLNWTFGSLIYLTEGVYEVEAQLLDANGSVLFQEPFYVDARAPYLAGSVIVALATLLGVVEALWIRSVVRYRRQRRGRYRAR